MDIFHDRNIRDSTAALPGIAKISLAKNLTTTVVSAGHNIAVPA